MISLILSVALAAQSPQVLSKDETCRYVGEMAELIMQKRQQEVPMSKLLDAVKGDPLEQLLRGVVMAAYQQPAFSSLEYQQREAAAFRNRWESTCHQSKLGN